MRAFTSDPGSLLVFLSGGANVGYGPEGPYGTTPPLSSIPGAQPASEKALNFCPIVGLVADCGAASSLAIPVDEKTQTFVSGVPFDEASQGNYR